LLKALVTPGSPAASTVPIGRLLTHMAMLPGDAATSGMIDHKDSPQQWSGERRPVCTAQVAAREELALAVAGADVEDNRKKLLPPNPTARLGSRNTLIRPIKHGRRLKLTRARRRLALGD
jgi:hypothetical protein